MENPEITELILAGRDREAALLGARSTRDVAPSTSTEGERMDPIAQLDQLGPLLAGVVTNITPAQLDWSTPCADFTVRGVLEHMITGATTFAGAFRGEASAEPSLEDVLAEFLPALGDLAAAIGSTGALDRIVATPFGDLPGETFARFVVLDGLVHGWDLSTATAQPYTPSDALVGAVDGFAREVLDPLRDGQAFGPAVPPPPDATPIECLAAYTGRRPLVSPGANVGQGDSESRGR